MHILLLVTDNNISWISGREENGHSYFMTNFQVWDRAGTELATPVPAVRHITDYRYPYMLPSSAEKFFKHFIFLRAIESSCLRHLILKKGVPGDQV